MGNRDEAVLEDADRDGRHEEPHAGGERLPAKLGRPHVAGAVCEERAADVGSLVHQDDAVGPRRRGDRRFEAGLAGPDHDDVGVLVLDVAPRAPCAVGVELPEARSPGGAPSRKAATAASGE